MRSHRSERSTGIAVDLSVLDDAVVDERGQLREGELFETRRRRDTLDHLPTELLAMVDGGKLSRQGRIDKLLASKTPAEVCLSAPGWPRFVASLVWPCGDLRKAHFDNGLFCHPCPSRLCFRGKSPWPRAAKNSLVLHFILH